MKTNRLSRHRVTDTPEGILWHPVPSLTNLDFCFMTRKEQITLQSREFFAYVALTPVPFALLLVYVTGAHGGHD